MALMAIVGVERHCIGKESWMRAGNQRTQQRCNGLPYHCEVEQSLQVLVETCVDHPPIVVEQQNILHVKLPTLESRVWSTRIKDPLL